MSGERQKKAELIFEEVVALSGEMRSSVLAKRCDGNRELRGFVEQLLASDDSGMGDFLSRPLYQPEPDRVPLRIGRYEIVRQIGQGGMAVVYEARQSRPRRTVAIKVIRSGLPSRDTLRRFEYEAEILGQLQHPGIAQVYEAGVAEIEYQDGLGPKQPFFTMELVRGEPLTSYADRHQLTIDQRLNLIAMTSDAVQHAHQMGVIHRDLKPGNILVDEGGQPKVLDFGVARLTNADARATATQTATGQLIGTLRYMSPEQVSGDAKQIDTRTDVYSLGAVLFELLAGRPPHDVSTALLPEAARKICEEVPTRLATIDRKLSGDIDTIVARALAKNKSRRYQSASELAADIRHCLRGEPIEARRDSGLYVLGKNLRRHRWAVAACVAFVVGLSGFALYAGMQAGRYGRLAEREREAHEQSLAAQQEAVEQRELAVAEARRAKDITAFLEDTFGLANPDITQTSGLTMKELLDRASEKVDASFVDQPEAEAAVRTAIGRAYASMGEPNRAMPHLYRAMQIREFIVDSPPEELYETLWAFSSTRGVDIGDRWNWRCERAFKLGLQIIGAQHEHIADALADAWISVTDLVDRESARHHRDAVIQLARERLASSDHVWRYVGDEMYTLGLRLEDVDRFDLAGPYLEEALDIRRRFLPETHTDIARALGKLSECYVATDRHEEGEALAREALELLERLLPGDHWYIAVNRSRLGASLVGRGRYQQAEPLLLESSQRIIGALGETSAWTLAVLNSLVRLYDAWDKPSEAALYRDRLVAALAGSRNGLISLPYVRTVLDPRHAELLAHLEELTVAIKEQRNDLEPTVDAVLDARRRLVPGDDPRAVVIAEFLRSLTVSIGQYGGSQEIQLRIYAEVIELFRASEMDAPLQLATALVYQAVIYEARGKFDLGGEAAREGLLLRQRHDESFELIANAKSVLGGCLARQGFYAEAEPLVREGVQGLLEGRGPANGVTLRAFERLTTLYRRWGRMNRAYDYLGPLLERALERANDSRELDGTSWAIVRFPGFGREAYARALEAARLAVEMAPNDAPILNTLGVAEYRVGRYEDALTTLARSNELVDGTNYADLAFLAMANHRLGRVEEAHSRLEQLRDLRIARPALNNIPECARMYREAEALIGSQ